MVELGFSSGGSILSAWQHLIQAFTKSVVAPFMMPSDTSADTVVSISTILDAIVRNRTIVTWSSLRASFEVNLCTILKTYTPLQRYCNSLNEDGLFAKIQQEMTP